MLLCLKMRWLRQAWIGGNPDFQKQGLKYYKKNSHTKYLHVTPSKKIECHLPFFPPSQFLKHRSGKQLQAFRLHVNARRVLILLINYPLKCGKKAIYDSALLTCCIYMYIFIRVYLVSKADLGNFITLKLYTHNVQSIQPWNFQGIAVLCHVYPTESLVHLASAFWEKNNQWKCALLIQSLIFIMLLSH